MVTAFAGDSAGCTGDRERHEQHYKISPDDASSVKNLCSKPWKIVLSPSDNILRS